MYGYYELQEKKESPKSQAVSVILRLLCFSP